MRAAVDVSDSPSPGPVIGLGREYFIDAYGCDPDRLRSQATLACIFDRVVADLGLQPLGHLWHQFPEPGGVTGLLMLSESHLTVHTFPESGVATVNLYCCRPRPDWPWNERLRESLGATDVRVQSRPRG